MAWICDATMRDGQTNKELKSKLGIESIKAMRIGRLHWFGYMERERMRITDLTI